MADPSAEIAGGVTLSGEMIVAAIVSAIVAWIIAHYQAKHTSRQEFAKRQSDLSVEVAKLLLESPDKQQAARRFAVGLVKVVDDNSEGQDGHVCFVPINSRVTLGRDASNDLKLSSQSVSRFHCGFYAEADEVFLEDYGSHNGTLVNGVRLASGEVRKLENGDAVSVSSYRLEFRYVHRSKLLMVDGLR